MSKTEIKSLRIRAQALRAEMNDPTCQKFPTARAHVEAELAKTLALLEGA